MRKVMLRQIWEPGQSVAGEPHLEDAARPGHERDFS
jgi:hypothetical protein